MVATPDDFKKTLMRCGRPGARAAGMLENNLELIDMLCPADPNSPLTLLQRADKAESEIRAAIAELNKEMGYFLLDALALSVATARMTVGERLKKACRDHLNLKESSAKRYRELFIVELALELSRRQKVSDEAEGIES